jgi:uncharacterized protein (TIGR02118 family)
MAKMTVIYATPKDPGAFDRHYYETHIPLAKKLPGLRKYEVSRGPVATISGPPGCYLIGTLHFDDLAAIQRAFASPEGQACAADRAIFAPSHNDFQMYLFDDGAV